MTTTTTNTATTTTGDPAKRSRCGHKHDNYEPLLPGLPDHLAHLCLSLVPPSILYSVCHSWRRLIYSSSFPPFPSLYALLSPSSPITNPDSIQFFAHDPISSIWHKLPPPPPDLEIQPLLLRHPSFLSRNLPIQSLTVSGHLILLAATTHHLLPALPRPLIFNPLSNHWHFGPQFSVPRRWCAVGSARNSVYMASGVGSHYSGEVARSMEKWDLSIRSLDWGWESMAPLKDGKFSREAVEAVAWRGKLCMVNVKGNTVKEGVVYDVERDRWEEMPEGMLGGWKGPAAAMDEEEIYVVDEKNGVLSKYKSGLDCWEEVIRSVYLKGAVQITANKGKVCAAPGGGGGRGIAVVDVVARPVRTWVIESPPGMQVIAVHVLPRMSSPEY